MLGDAWQTYLWGLGDCCMGCCEGGRQPQRRVGVLPHEEFAYASHNFGRRRKRMTRPYHCRTSICCRVQRMAGSPAYETAEREKEEMLTTRRLRWWTQTQREIREQVRAEVWKYIIQHRKESKTRIISRWILTSEVQNAANCTVKDLHSRTPMELISVTFWSFCIYILQCDLVFRSLFPSLICRRNNLTFLHLHLLEVNPLGVIQTDVCCTCFTFPLS